ncbi:hypothetical protein AJ79_10202, partial [Helicocarpus griseus UAMH5409]
MSLMNVSHSIKTVESSQLLYCGGANTQPSASAEHLTAFWDGLTGNKVSTVFEPPSSATAIQWKSLSPEMPGRAHRRVSSQKTSALSIPESAEPSAKSTITPSIAPLRARCVVQRHSYTAIEAAPEETIETQREVNNRSAAETIISTP